MMEWLNDRRGIRDGDEVMDGCTRRNEANGEGWGNDDGMVK